MLSRIRGASSSRPEQWLAASTSSRSVSSTSVWRAPPTTPSFDRDVDEDEANISETPKAPTDPSYADWLQNVGRRFKGADTPKNWLGDQTPFPLNPSFKPPIPISNSRRELFYRLYMHNPEVNSVRNLSGRFHVGMKRMDAILRLQGLEAHWKGQGRELQTGFRDGMELLLGIKEDEANFRSQADWVESRMDVVESDVLDQVEGDDPARARYQRMFWEPVVEGQQPVLPDALKQARDDAVRHGIEEESAKSRDDLLGHHHESGSATEVVAKSGAAAGRPAIKFVDIGGKFIDPKDRLRRMKESERRARLRKKARAAVAQRS
ncbi:hypothetical protein FA95DRAFT_1557070 [Auriscalpium vulgare]|uniref:Uncharacterized protein n=1 Tax=Auriscalpium vulgare TaxID=40419 RepID=A0ACB8RZJ4_9AGAM|nr:hypothetical protein FA95DRAFT_1557070 [Auriscalpium vulgare]